MPLCQLCDEPGADKRWSASLQMAAWTAAAWGVGPWVVMVRGVITVLLHFQVKMGTHKRKSIVGSMLRFACLSHSLTHTGSLSAVWFLLCCRGCCVCDGSDLWNLHSRTPPPLVSGNDILAFPSDILLPQQPGGNSLSGDCRHMWKRQQSKCVQCRVKRTCYATTWICWAMSGKGNTTSHNICFWNKSLTCHNPNLLCLHMKQGPSIHILVFLCVHSQCGSEREAIARKELLKQRLVLDKGTFLTKPTFTTIIQ